MGAEIIRFLSVTPPIFSGLNKWGNFLCKIITLSDKSFIYDILFEIIVKNKGTERRYATRERRGKYVKFLTQLQKIKTNYIDRGGAIQYNFIDT